MSHSLKLPGLIAVGLVAALAVALALTLTFSSSFGGSAQAQAAGGPVILMGIDAEDGGPGGHGPITVYEDVVSSILSGVTNGGSGILVIGGGRSASDGPTTFWDAISADLGVAVTYVNGDANVAAQSFAGFAMIAIVSSEFETGNGLTQDENDALAARIADFVSFVNGGGGLLGFSQAGFTNPYDYIGGLGSFDVRINLGYDDITPTAEGSAIGITDDLDVCCWHDTYITFPDFLEVLAVNNDSSDPGFGEAAAIGGAEVVLQPEGPFGAASCEDGIDNDGDTLIDAEDPDCAPPSITLDPASATNNLGTDHTVTATVELRDEPAPDVDVSFDITDGPNAGETATGTTDDAGQASFTFTGDGGAGTDTIEACFLDELEEEQCTTATKEWVEAAPSPTPTPTAVAEEVQEPVALPETGGEPGGGSGLAWLVVLAGVIALVSGGLGLGLAYARRRVR